MFEAKKTPEFQLWESEIKDKRLRTSVAARIARLCAGNKGNHKYIGDGIIELKIDYGSGYRIYTKQITRDFILVLCGGDKSDQQSDIEAAKNIAKKWKVSK